MVWRLTNGKRDIDRFPPEFMFQLSEKEYESLRSQNVISKEELPFCAAKHALFQSNGFGGQTRGKGYQGIGIYKPSEALEP